MRCQDVERLIPTELDLGPVDRARMEAHLAQCSRCSDFREFWRALHGHVAGLRTPELPAGLAEKVRRTAHAGLIPWLEEDSRPAVPGFIWAALAAITILTLGFLIPGVQDFIENQKVTLGTALVLILILQNALMLVFAPVVLRQKRHLQGG